jgi:hypothetical protein
MNSTYYARLRLYFNLVGYMEIANDLASDHNPAHRNAAFNPPLWGHNQIARPGRLGADIAPHDPVDP